ncbi:hypothetical protein RIF29_15681 [Crotalaria pallida]|uniref:Uncharacterized protein n=1 Tax=Crotalaria pallida TaxID=3830 RepID=A0AAN9IEV6_CROPI
MAFNISPLSSISLEWSSWNVRVRVLQNVIVYEVHDATPNTVLNVLFVDAQELGFCDSFSRAVGSGRRTSVEDHFMCNYPHIMLSQLSSVNEAVYFPIFPAVDPGDIHPRSRKTSNPIRSAARNTHTLRGKDVCGDDLFCDIRRNLIPHFEAVSKEFNAPEADADDKGESSSDCACNAGSSVPFNTCDPKHVLYNFLSTP